MLTRKNFYLNLILTAVWFSAVFARPALYAAAGKSGAEFLREDTGARSLGMGSAFTSVSDDASFISANPAGLHYMAYPELSAMYKSDMLDAYYGSFGFVYPRKNFTLGMGAVLYDGGLAEINLIGDDGAVTSRDVKAQQDMALAAGAGTNIGEWLFAGASVKYISSRLAEEYSASAAAFDAGVIFRPPSDRFSAGIAAKNFGTPLNYRRVEDPLPSEVRFGASYKPVDSAEHTLLASADVVSPLEDVVRYNVGAEYCYAGMASLRGGYGYSAGGQGEMSFGFGVTALNGRLDYGYITRLDEQTHKVSFAARFGASRFYDIGESYLAKGMPLRAKSYFARVPQKDPAYASAREKMSEIDTDIARRKAAFAALARRKDLEKQGIVSREGLKAPGLSVENVVFKDQTGDRVLAALEEGRVEFEVSNAAGAGAAFDVAANISADRSSDEIKFNKYLRIGDIRGGTSKKVSVPLSALARMRSGEMNLTIAPDEKYGFAPDAVLVKIPTRRLEPPDIRIARMEIDDGRYPGDESRFSFGDGDGMIQKGESVEVTLTVVNSGTGETVDAYVTLVSASQDVSIIAGGEPFHLGNLKPGEWKKIFFAFSVTRVYSGPEQLPVSLKFADSRKIFDAEIPVGLVLEKSYPKIQVVKIDGTLSAPSASQMPTFGEELRKLPAFRTPRRDNAYAVIIGIEKYRDLVSVDYAARDASLVREYLVNAMGFREENIVTALNERAGKSDLIKHFETWLRNRVDKDSVVFIYYSGHGAPNPVTGDSFMVPYDGDPNVIDDTGYALKRLYESLNSLPTDKILVVLDSCFSGAGGPRTVLARGTRAIAVTMREKALETGKIAVFAASSGKQISGSYDEKQHGLFTYYFLRGLQGAAVRTGRKDITLADIYDYVRPNVIRTARHANRDQEPQILPSPSQLGVWGALPLAVLR